MPSKNVFKQPSAVSAADRAAILKQKGCVVWVTGLSGAGKSTIATALERHLVDNQYMAYVLDGDNIRTGLSQDLKFSNDDRTENIRRIAEVSNLFCDCGIICISAFISPFRLERDRAREIVGSERFFEVHIDTPLATCEDRDVKGLYKKARAGEIKDFTGINSPYEPPLEATLTLDTTKISLEDCVQKIRLILEEKGIISKKS